ncbi:MAG TPA: cytochrome P450 [Alphaproteobacteria bacterium]|jgi:cytochrome P450 family 142 subfamily A polypeptide 1|nr:cytochrome P450 [Alphaproteobacteria bacterium]
MDSAFAFDPFDAAQTHAIAETARRLAREKPVLRMANGFVLASRYDDVKQILTNSTVFINAGGFRPNGLHVPIEDRTLGELDPPEHGPIRRLAIGAAGPAAVEPLRAFTRENCRALLEPILKRGHGDLVQELSLVLTNRVIAKALGVPQKNSNWLAEKAEEILSSDMPVTNRTPSGFGYKAAFPEFTGFIDDLIQARLANPGDVPDAMSRIIDTAREAGDAPAETIIRMVLIQLILGGTATTRDFLGHLFHELIQKPELHEALRADLSLLPVAVEEGLRLAPPVLFVIRTCAVETVLGGVTLHPGERIIAATGVANRDPTVYEDPDELRLDRVDPAPHLTFGLGSHFCVGNMLARMESREALEIFVERVKPGSLRTAPGFELRFMPTPFLYGPVSLPVELVERPS